MKKKMVIHSTSPKVAWTLCAAFSEWCDQLSSSISTAAPNIAMVAGSRCSGRANTKPTITTVSTTSACLSSSQSSIDALGSIAITRAWASGLAFRSLPQSTWMITACTAMMTTMTGAR